MDLSMAKRSVKALLSGLDNEDQVRFMSWIQSTSMEALLNSKTNADDEDSDADTDLWDPESTENKQSLLILESIRQDLQDLLPPSCIFDSETIVIPKCSEMCGDDATKVEHVDAFVYDEEDLDIACTLGKLSRSYCAKCGSKDIKDLEFISHSFSVDQVKFITTQLLSPHRGKVLLDIGSRTGALLYGVALFTSLKRSIGVEINKQFADLSMSLVKKYNMADRVSIITDDIMNCADYMQQADIFVMHNVFEFFTCPNEQARLWRFCLEEIKKRSGAILMTTPAVENSLKNINMEYDLSFLEQVSIQEEVDRYCRLNADADLDIETLNSIHVYKIA